MASAMTNGAEKPAQVASFIRYSERAADGGWIEKNGKYSFEMEDHDAVIRNARLADTSFETHGFTLERHPADIDWSDKSDFERRYYPSVCELVKRVSGADEVFAFLGIWRGGEDAKGGGPALSAHVDFNPAAVREWIGRVVPERAEELQRKRLVNINVWRGTRPVHNYPLAVCDARTVAREDFLQVSLGKPEGGFRDGMPAGLNMAYSPRHEWYYYPDMQVDEALVFRLCDTADPDWKFTGHTAFEDPTSPPNSPPRESFEVRTIAVFDE